MLEVAVNRNIPGTLDEFIDMWKIYLSEQHQSNYVHDINDLYGRICEHEDCQNVLEDGYIIYTILRQPIPEDKIEKTIESIFLEYRDFPWQVHYCCSDYCTTMINYNTINF